MKKIYFLSVVCLFLGNVTFSIDVKLKITYKDQPVVGHTVSVMLGDAKLGDGVTDDGGEVTVSVSSLPVKDIDLKGEKKCEGASKSWSVSGFVRLDGNNYAHLKMEDPINQMAEASGGFMSVDMLVASYGLLCSGAASSSSNGSSNQTDNASTSTDTENDAVDTEPMMSPEESLQARKTVLENKIVTSKKKIDQKKEKLSKPGITDSDKKTLEFEIKELELEQALDQCKLEQTNLMIEKNGVLNKEERTRFNTREDQLKNELKALKESQKSSGIENSASQQSTTEQGNEDKKVVTEDKEVKEEKNVGMEEPGKAEADRIQAILNADSLDVSAYVDFDVNKLSTMTEEELQKSKTKCSTDSNNKTLLLRAKGRWMEENERKKLENEIASCDKVLLLIEAETARREAIRKAEKKNN